MHRPKSRERPQPFRSKNGRKNTLDVSPHPEVAALKRDLAETKAASGAQVKELKVMLPQEDGTEIFWGVTKITEAEILPKYWIGKPDRG